MVFLPALHIVRRALHWRGQWIPTVQDPFLPPTSPLAAIHAEKCGLDRSPPTTRVIGFTTYNLAANPWHEDESRFDLANAMLSATGPVCPGADVGTVSVAICRPRSRCLPCLTSNSGWASRQSADV